MTLTRSFPAIPSSASPLYKRLHATTIEFFASMSPSTLDVPRLTKCRTEDFQQVYGHQFFTSLHPEEYGTPMTLDKLIVHMEQAIPLLAKWDVDVSDILIDELRLAATVRCVYGMVAKGATEEVENEMVWLLEMDEESGKVKKAVEFKDPVADARFKETMKAALQS